MRMCALSMGLATACRICMALDAWMDVGDLLTLTTIIRVRRYPFVRVMWSLMGLTWWGLVFWRGTVGEWVVRHQIRPQPTQQQPTQQRATLLPILQLTLPLIQQILQATQQLTQLIPRPIQLPTRQQTQRPIQQVTLQVLIRQLTQRQCLQCHLIQAARWCQGWPPSIHKSTKIWQQRYNCSGWAGLLPLFFL